MSIQCVRPEDCVYNYNNYLFRNGKRTCAAHVAPHMTPSTHFVWKSSGSTDVGAYREVNEDAFLNSPETGLWVVADGMGGHAAGDLASGGVVDTLSAVPSPTRLSASVDDIELRLTQLNQRLREMAEREDVHTIGSTVAALLAHGQHGVCLWAGDSRIYRIREGSIEQLTQDHALVEELVERGVIKPEEAADHPQSNLVTRAVGAGEQLCLDVEIFELSAADRFIVCSDGLDKEVSPEDMAGLSETSTIERLSATLVDLALKRGARDNVTVVCMEVQAAEPATARPGAHLNVVAE